MAGYQGLFRSAALSSALLLAGGAHAQSTDKNNIILTGGSALPTITLYGFDIPPDQTVYSGFEQQWRQVADNLDTVFPNADDRSLSTPKELCEHVEAVNSKNAVSAETYSLQLVSSLSKAIDSSSGVASFIGEYGYGEAPILGAVLTALNDDEEAFQSLSSLYGGDAQAYLGQAREATLLAQQSSMVYGATLQTYPECRPDAGYDPDAPEEAAKWDKIQEWWDAGSPPDQRPSFE
ncbi:MAG: hypothetical protein GW778_01600 [Alphaproteobacteria bacterium]|nr:hypothetical protein [Alphaproteobacteria bacterium]